MLNALDIDATQSFLKICKREINKRNCYFVGYRKININGKTISAKQALIDIGIMKEKDIWKHILDLKPSDCIKVERNKEHLRDLNSEVYVFKKLINKKIVYIKLTINEKGVICISFHESNNNW